MGFEYTKETRSYMSSECIPNLTLWSALGKYTNARLMPIIKFGMGSQVLQKFLFHTVLRKIKSENFLKKKQNTLFWSPFDPGKSKNKISANIRQLFLRCWKYVTLTKSQQKPINNSYENCWNDRLKQWEMDRQQWFRRNFFALWI